MAKPIEMPLGLWIWVGPRKHVIHGVRIGATWRIRLKIEPSMCGSVAAFLSNYFDHLFMCLLGAHVILYFVNCTVLIE